MKLFDRSISMLFKVVIITCTRILTTTKTTTTWAVMYTVAKDSANQKPANQLDALPWCRVQDSHCRWDHPAWLAEVCHVYAAPAVVLPGPIWALGLICSARSASPDILCNVSYMQTHTTPTTNWNGIERQGYIFLWPFCFSSV